MVHRSQINRQTLVAREWSRKCNSRPYYNATSITHEWRTRPWCIGDISTAKSVTPLPSVYSTVPTAAMKTQHFTAPAVQRPARPPDLLAAEAAVQ